MGIYAVVKNSTQQALKVGSVPSWSVSLPPGTTCVVLSSAALPDPATPREPVRTDGKLRLGEGGIVTVEDGVLRRMTDDEITASAEVLGALKEFCCTAVNDRTDELEALGFEYPPGSGVRYRMDADMRINVAQLNNDRDSPAMPWNQDPPSVLPYNSLDDSTVLTISSADDIHNFYLAGLGAYLALKASSTAIKNLIRAAATATELLAIVDTR